MRRSICGKALLVGACLWAAAPARAQQAPSQAAETNVSLAGAVVYNSLLSNVAGGNAFWMQGVSAQFDGRFWPGLHGPYWRGLGVAADVARVHTAHTNGSGVGLDLVTAAFGPRYTWSPERRRYALFGQALAGHATGLNGIFPAPNGAVATAGSLALYVGGGLNMRLSDRLAVRAFEADWLRTQMPNASTGVQNNLRLGAGLIFRFK